MEKITVGEARRLRGISQEDAAEHLGLSDAEKCNEDEVCQTES